MKKKFLSCLLLSLIAFTSCDKDQLSLESTASKDTDDVIAPTVSFTVTARDASGSIVTVEEGTAVSARTVTVRYTGGASSFKSIYTGDAGRVYIANPSNPPTGITTAQSGLNFPDSLTYTYAAAGTYPITVIAANVGNKGRVIEKSVVSKTIILR